MGSGLTQDEVVAALSAGSQKVAGALAGTDASRWKRSLNDPDLRKYFHRLHDVLLDLLRLVSIKEPGVESKSRALHLLRELDARLTKPETESVWALLYEFQLLLIQLGDEPVICGMVEAELVWHKGQTSWVTWDELYPHPTTCAAVEDYRTGAGVDPKDLEAARHMLAMLYRARRDDQLAHRSRAQARSKNLLILAGILTLLIPLFLLAYWYASHPHPSVWATVTLPIAGAVGAALSGTLKAKDQLSRESEIGRFRDGLLAQLLVGAAAAVIVVVILRAKLTSIGDIKPSTIVAQAAFGFLAGFSEPFVLGVVGRASNLGSAAKDTPATASA